MYRVKEIFYTLQGEGARAGRPAVFCRFAGCNLWTGHEQDRQRAVCQFCDTDFVGVGPDGGRFPDGEALAEAVEAAWPTPDDRGRYVVCTGGEPTLQLDNAAVWALQLHGFEVAIETNGTRPTPPGVQWICVSPKAGTDLVQTTGNELKLIYPQVGAEPERYAHLAFDQFRLQPMDGPDLAANLRATVDYCLAHPRWSLSLQTHKLIGVR